VSKLHILLFVTLFGLLGGAGVARVAGGAPEALPLAPAEAVVQPRALEMKGAAATEVATDVLVGENAKFQLYANAETLAFKVVDRRSGYVWHSNLDEKMPSDRLNKTWTAFATSGISIDFVDQKVNEKRASITSAEHTIEFQQTGQGFLAHLTFSEPSISLSVSVQLNERGVSVEIPFASLHEADPAYRLGTLHVYPFFAATRVDDVPGYLFIPDGSGSLIHFAAETKAKNMFYGRYYGADLGMLGSLPYDPTTQPPHKISIPVIGMVHGEGENAYLAIVEQGASYGEFRAHPAGIITNFNFLYNAFTYNASYFQATSRSGAGVTVLQPSTNPFDVKINYRFLTGGQADYVGMARSYRDYLIEQDELSRTVTPGSDIGIRLEFLAGDKERVLFWDRMIPMTTISQMRAILDDLQVKNPQVVYYGWQPDGASSMPPKTFKLDGSLGTPGELAALIGDVQATGGQFNLYVDPQAAFWDEPGYSTRSDLAVAIINENIIGYNRDKVNFFRNFASLSQFYTSLNQDVWRAVGAGLALDGIGTNLYSDFKDGNFISREQAIQQYRALLAADGSDNLVALRSAFYRPNHYLFRYMQAYYDIPVTDSGYIYTTATVPFLQIVFAGMIPFYGPALNFSSNLQEDLLRYADFGVYPSFFVSEGATARILNTRSNWIFSSAYTQWGDEIKRTYQWLNDRLGPVYGQEIIARQQLAPGVYATTYANGKVVIVNYTAQPAALDGVTVNGKDAVLSEVQP
jgi:hypothetical protein